MARALLEAAERLARTWGPVRARALLRLAEERVFVGDETDANRLQDEADWRAAPNRLRVSWKTRLRRCIGGTCRIEPR